MRSEMTVREAFDRAHTSEFHAWPVTDERGVVGVICLDWLEKTSANGEEGKQLRDFVNGRDFPHVHADQPLHMALERMGSAKLDVLPVVSRANIHHMMGVVALPDVLSLYGINHPT